jgi:hypothetical protein
MDTHTLCACTWTDAETWPGSGNCQEIRAAETLCLGNIH